MIAVGISSHRLGESPFPEVEMPTTRSLPLAKRDSSADSAIRPTVQCGMGVSPARESLVLRVKRQTHNFWNQQKQAHIDYQAHLKSKKVKAERIKTYNDIP